MVSASASLSVDVAAVVVIEVIVKEVTADVMLERGRRVHHLESSLLNCEYCQNLIFFCQTWLANVFTAVVVSDVVLAVVELLLHLKCHFVLLACCIRQKYVMNTLEWLGWTVARLVE
jgi:hypothetical protein